MAGQFVQYGRHRKRRNYARISEVLELPNLIEIQTESYEWFLEEGLLEMFRDISPIEDFTGNLSLEFVDYRLGEPKYDLEESKNRDTTYSAPLRVKVRLIIKETGEVKEQEVFIKGFVGHLYIYTNISERQIHIPSQMKPKFYVFLEFRTGTCSISIFFFQACNFGICF